REDARSALRGTIAGASVSWLPGLGGGGAATLASVGTRRTVGPSQFMVVLGAVSTSTALLSVAVLFIIHRARSGAAAAVRGLAGDLAPWPDAWAAPASLLLLVMSAVLATAIAAPLAARIGRGVAKRWSRSNRRRIAAPSLLAVFVPGPQTPVQIAKRTGLRLPHVSRTLGQLVRAEMAHCVGGERRGKLYAASRVGLAVWGELSEARGDRLVAPMIRGSHFRNYHHWIAVHHGRAAADKTLIEAGVDPALIHADRWYPLRSALDVLEHVETRFGDGTYETVRRMMRDEAINFTSLRRFVKRVIPFPILLELSPN